MGSNTRAGRVIRDNVSNIELLVIYMILLGVTSIPISLIVLGIAYASGHPTQFSPSDEPRLGFHAGPTERGTLNIVYVCTSTVFACVYLSLHSDVPHPAKPDELANALKQTKAPRFVPVIVRFLTRNSTFRRVLFMLFNVFAPELVVLVALLELVSATDGKRFMRSRGQKGWSTTLAFFADMGGFELDEELAKFEVVERHGGSMDGFERDEGHAKEAAGKRDEGTILENGTHFQNGRAFLEWFDKYYHAQCGDVKVDIETLEEEINDRSKKDTVLKLLTLCQSSWLFIETMARFLEKRAVSEMEVTTCAYIFCTLITYVCWMKKPYSITSRVVLRRSHLKPRSPPPDSSHEEHTISRTGTTSDPLRPLLLSADSNASELSNELKFPLPQMIYDNARFSPFNRSYRYPDLSWLAACLAAGVIGALVGLIHAIPLWNALFSFSTGQWLWRLCSIMQVLLPISIALVAVVEWWYWGAPLLWVCFSMAWLYCIVRIMLFGLVALSFGSLPASVYLDVDWSSSYFPHLH